MSFYDIIQKHDPKLVLQEIESMTAADVQRALAAEQLDPRDFMALLSPAAETFIEEIAQQAHAITLRRFGRTILLYAPLYLSNECHNSCLYCGFSVHNRIPRRTLTLDEIEKDARILHDQGFRHILLLTGEAPGLVDGGSSWSGTQRRRDWSTTISSLQLPSVSDHCFPLSASKSTRWRPPATGKWSTPGWMP